MRTAYSVQQLQSVSIPCLAQKLVPDQKKKLNELADQTKLSQWAAYVRENPSADSYTWDSIPGGINRPISTPVYVPTDHEVTRRVFAQNRLRGTSQFLVITELFAKDT